MKKLLALSLVVLLVFTSCNKPGKGKDDFSDLKEEMTNGMYVEEELLVLSEEEYVIGRQRDGLKFWTEKYDIDSNNNSIMEYSSVDGIKWDSKPALADSFKKFNDEYAEYNSDGFAVSPSGDFYGYFKQYDPVSSKSKDVFVKFTETDFEIIDISGLIDVKEGEDFFIMNMIIPADDRLFLKCQMNGGSTAAFSGEESASEEAPQGGEEAEASTIAPVSDEPSVSSEGSDSEIQEESQETEGSVKDQFISYANESKSILIDLSKGEIVKEYTSENSSWFASSEYLYSVDDQMEFSIIAYSLKDGEEDQAASIQSDYSKNGFWGQNVFFVDEKNDIYFLDADGIQHITDGGGIVETIMPSIGYAFSISSNIYVDSFQKLADGSFIAMFSDNGAATLYRYYFDDTIDLSKQTQIEVFSLVREDRINAGIANLRKTKPEISVNYEIAFPDMYSTEEVNAQDLEDKLKVLNTELLAGEGPDIIVMDGLDAKNYIDKGLLEDFDQLVDTSKVLPNIMTAINQDKFYLLPTGAKVPVIIGLKENVDKVNSIDDLIAGLKSKPLADFTPYSDNTMPKSEESRAFIHFSSYDEIMSVLYNYYKPAIVDENGVNKEVLSTMLQQVKEIYDYSEIKEEEGVDGGMGFSAGMGGYSLTGYLNSNIYAVTEGQSSVGVESYQGYLTSYLMLNAVDNGKYTYAKVMPSANGNSFTPLNVLGISVNSKNKEAAAAFLQVMISDKVQTAYSEKGFAVTETAITSQMESFKSFMIKSNEELEKAIKEDPEFFAENSRYAYMAKYEDIQNNPLEIMSNVENASYDNGIISTPVINYGREYVTGKMELEEAISKIHDDTKFYFAEK